MVEKSKQNQELRKRAIELFKSNWKVTDICRTLNCSRKWFYKWQKRYKTGEQTWSKDQSRAPKHTPNRRSKVIEKKIIEVRNELVSTPFMQYGPQAIYYRLQSKGEVPPEIWTISRVLKENNLSKPNRKQAYISKGKDYPYEYYLCQQMDYVGPRYLYSKERFYFFSIICCETHYGQVTIYKNQTSSNVCNSLLLFWKALGPPDYLQMDNDLSFWGSLNKPTALGKVIRLCLANKVTPVFIPQREPWRNGIIEHFNHTMQASVLSLSKFKNVKQLQQATNKFCEAHNQNHHYSTQDGMTPLKRLEYLNNPYTKLEKNVSITDEKQALEEGEIHIIRFIRSDLKFNIFGLRYNVPEVTKYEYVKGVILTEKHVIKIYRDKEFVAEYKFALY